MTKSIIGVIVGAALIFIWQFLSWGLLNLHEDAQKYTPKQDSILACLSSQLSEDGRYMLPSVPKGASQEEREALQKAAQGKPYAMVNYVKSLNENMGMNMTRGFLVNIVIVFLLIWMLKRMASPTFMTILFSSLAVGIMGWFFTPYTEHIWFKTPWVGVQAELVDALVAWGLTGLWLGWWLNRK